MLFSVLLLSVLSLLGVVLLVGYGVNVYVDFDGNVGEVVLKVLFFKG